jgi:TetR/AcrR family transcriptional regulator
MTNWSFGDVMVDPKFERLSADKKHRIIEGAIREFAEYGYAGASTNRIVKEVGIAKGSLFNYFASKDDLWLYVAEYALDIVIPLLQKRMEDLPPDILERLTAMTEASIDVYIENPLYYRFFMGVLEEGAVHLRQELLRRNAAKVAVLDFLQGADTTRFRADVESTALLIKWLFAGIKQELFEMESVRQDAAALKKGFVERVERVLGALRDGIYLPEA